MTFNEPEERLHAPQVKSPHQLPHDVGHDGEDREVALKPLPPPERGVLQSKGLDVPWSSSISHTTGLLDFLAERGVGRVEVPDVPLHDRPLAQRGGDRGGLEDEVGDREAPQGR